MSGCVIQRIADAGDQEEIRQAAVDAMLAVAAMAEQNGMSALNLASMYLTAAEQFAYAAGHDPASFLAWVERVAESGAESHGRALLDRLKGATEQ